jgi:hypothetical protein
LQKKYFLFRKLLFWKSATKKQNQSAEIILKMKAKTKSYNIPKRKKADGKGVKRKKKLLKKRAVLVRKKKIVKTKLKKKELQKKPSVAPKKKRTHKKSGTKNVPKKFTSQKILGQYLRDTKIDYKHHGKLYRRMKLWENIFDRIEKGIENFFKFVFWFSYRAAVFSFVAVLIYAITPGALAELQTKTISTKAQWEEGALTNASTYNTANARDAIQLKSSGDWTARVWAPPEDIIGQGHTSAMADNYLYVMRGYSDKAFWRYDTVNNTWETLPDLPMPAYYGADMAYDQNGNIFMIFGGYSTKFYKYNIASKTFTAYPDLPDTPWYGASITINGTDAYVVRGNNTSDFWKYDITENNGAWGTSLTLGNVYTGGDLVNAQNGYLYLVRGGNTRTFDRYNLTSKQWEATPADLPATGCTGTACNMNGEEHGVYYNGYIYFLRSQGYTDVLRYKVSDPGADTWEILTSDPTPIINNYTSLTVNSNDHLIYAFRSNGFYDLWKFDASADAGKRWVGPQQVNNGTNGTVGTGGDLIWNHGSGASNFVYCIRGGSTANFYKYDVTGNAWSSLTNVPYSPNNDIKGTWNQDNSILYLPQYNTTTIRTFNGTDWNTTTATLGAAASNGASLAYNSGNQKMYALRGGGQQTLYGITTANLGVGGTWPSMAPMSVTESSTTFNYYANVGARVVSDDTNLFIMPGDGETTFLRYNTGVNNYTRMAPTPFSQWYGTDMTYNGNGKIIAIAGYYKDETWEYDIGANSWRRLSNNPKYTYGRGPYQGASIEYDGVSGTARTYYATSGQALPDMWSFVADSAKYPVYNSDDETTQGVYVSQSMDLSEVSSWSSFTYDQDKPTSTDIIYETRTSADNQTWTNWEAISGGNIQSAAHRYIQVRIKMRSTTGASTPTVFDYTISYSSEDNRPENPSSITATSQQLGGSPILSSETHTYDHPYFDWPEAEAGGGATDNDGSGVAGYYVYFGTQADANPVDDGIFTASTSYFVNETLSSGTYYLRIKTKDNNGNAASSVWDAFTYIYKGVSPPQTLPKTSQDDFNGGTMDKTSATSVSGSLRLQSKAGSWNEVRLSLAPGSLYSGSKLALSSCKGSSNHCLYAFLGNGSTTFYRYEIETDTWTTSPTTIPVALGAVNSGSVLVAGPPGYLYALRGNNTSDFWTFDIENNMWSATDSAPKLITNGSSLQYDGSRYLYATVGNDDAFYRYDTCNGVSPCTTGWTQKTNTNFGNPNVQTTSIGADSVIGSDGDVYASQGGYYPYFSKYKPSSNSWSALSEMPGGPYNGGALVYDNDNNDIYALAGKGRLSMYKYDIDTDTWTTAPDVPATISYGASMMKFGDYIYMTRGGSSTGFYRYSISKATWQLPKFGFFGPHYLGSSYFNYYYGTTMADNGSDSLYMIRAYYDNTFGIYNTETGEYTDLARLPVGAYQGASIVYDGDEKAVYYNPGNIRTVRSGKNNYFFKYDITANTWSEVSANPPAQTYNGSSMAYDGSRYIYLTAGNNTQTWWQYDTCHGITPCTPGWVSMPTASGAYWGDGGKILSRDRFIYATRGAGNATSWRYTVSGAGAGTWAALQNLTGTLGAGSSLVDGGDGYIYAARGGNSNTYYRYDTSQATSSGTWSTLSGNIPAQVNIGGSGDHVSNRNWITAGNGTNTFQDGLYGYIVGSESANIGFEESGSYESEAIDLASVYHWANLTANYDLPKNTSIKFETSSSADGSSWSGWSEVSNVHTFGDTRVMTIGSTAARYIKVKISFSSSDQIFSPRVDDLAINYYQDMDAPTNPSSASAWSIQTATPQVPKTVINGDTWYRHLTPYFEWPAADTAGGASDNSGGSGVAGYYVYFGTDSNGDPASFQTETNYTASNLTSGETYYLRIQAKDNANNIPADSYTAFVYKYDSTAPSNSADISVTPAGFTSDDNFVFLWTNDAKDESSGVTKYQYQTGGDGDVWFDISDPNTVTITIPNAEHAVGAYQPGKNTFYIRAVDNAGNTSAPISQDFYYSATAPSPPQNLTAVPEYSPSNMFAFIWNQPASYVGDASKIKYYYSINAKPTRYNTVETAAKAVGPSPFASQKGTNTFYVVAKDEAGNIDWSLYAEKEFVADTSNPPVPGNIQAFDTSDRESQEYSVAVKWSTPSGIDASNFAGYAIFRSEDNQNFSEVATTSGSAFVDTALESKIYYYYVESKDKTNNYSAASSTVSLIPTGRYTTAPTVVQAPSTTIQSFQATFRWATNRVCSSFVEYGTTIKLGETTGQVDSLTDHEVLVKGLNAGTKYFFRVKFIDVDGNIGTSEIDNFTTLPPPTISEFTISDVGLTAATVSYSTNTGGMCTLKYGKGAYTTTKEETASSTSHVNKLENLESSSIYNVMVDCVDGDGNAFSSDEYTFTTLRQPVVSEPQADNKENVDIPTVIVSYKTDEPTTTLIKFKSGDESSYHNYLTNNSVTDHQATIEGLEPTKEYELILSGMSASGVEAAPQTMKITTRSDSRPPEVVTNRAVGKVNGRGADAQATIYIKVETDELTRVKINLTKGVSVSGFDQNTPEDSENTYHLINIPVEAGQVYSYQVEAYDQARNQTFSAPSTIVVEDKKDNAAEIVTNTFSTQFGWLGSLFKK